MKRRRKKTGPKPKRRAVFKNDVEEEDDPEAELGSADDKPGNDVGK